MLSEFTVLIKLIMAFTVPIYRSVVLLFMTCMVYVFFYVVRVFACGKRIGTNGSIIAQLCIW